MIRKKGPLTCNKFISSVHAIGVREFEGGVLLLLRSLLGEELLAELLHQLWREGLRGRLLGRNLLLLLLLLALLGEELVDIDGVDLRLGSWLGLRRQGLLLVVNALAERVVELGLFLLLFLGFLVEVLEGWGLDSHSVEGGRLVEGLGLELSDHVLNMELGIQDGLSVLFRDNLGVGIVIDGLEVLVALAGLLVLGEEGDVAGSNGDDEEDGEGSSDLGILLEFFWIGFDLILERLEGGLEGALS